MDFSGCLMAQQQSAWSCNLYDQTLVLTVSEGDNGTIMSLIDTNPMLQYGTQPPVVTSERVELVQDPQTPDTAYAWYFQTTYDKLVVLDVNNGLLPLDGGSYRKRDNSQASQPWYATGLQQKSSSNDEYDPEILDNVYDPQAWFCYWNSTFVEVLMYADNSTTADENSSSSSTAPSTSTTLSTSPSPPTTSAPPTTVTAPASISSTLTSGSWPSMFGIGPQVVSSSAIMANSGLYHPPRGLKDKDPTTSESYASETTPPPSISASTTTTTSQSDVATNSTIAPTPSRRIKIEERRIPALNAPPPTCTLMQHGTDGQWRIHVQPNGLLPVVALKEQDPPAPPWGVQKRDIMPATACGCVWDSPNGQQET